ncbi:deoxyguanosinetriphosphate triphosphohydrolase, partial [Candidatus Saccharibacteria bacterium]|nr:deoxyguanosinetriphosphate triphosphohydrolase [Candidatus Saccharibacteria bacterium]NIV04333.1 deoxyguanosinetriphosphate triphosphohydrolase [Calditrichia bacterium]
KYKSLMSQHDNPDRYFLYEDQLNERNFVFANHSLPEELSDPEKLNTFRSIECQIMDWADDTAYSLHDIIDGIHARLITRGELEEWAEEGELNQTESSLVETIINEMVDGNVERTFSRKIGDFINACQLEERENFLSPFTERYHYQLRVNAQISAEASLYKTIAEDIVFSSAQMQQLRFKWDHILEKLFWALTTNYIDK